MKSYRGFHVSLFLCLVVSTARAVDFPIVYVRVPRFGDGTQPGDRVSKIPEAGNPVGIEPGSDLMMAVAHIDLVTRTGSISDERVLVDGGEFGAVIDPKTLDGVWVYYALIPDTRPVDNDLKNVARSGSDIWKINTQTGEKIQLTHQEWTPNRGAVNYSRQPNGRDSGQQWPTQQTIGYGVFNTAPQPLPDGRVIFTSTRNGLLPNANTVTNVCLQLFLMDDDGKNVEQVGFLNLAGAEHPTFMTDGRVAWSSLEGHGHRSGISWSVWASKPDGRTWEPMLFQANGGGAPNAWHWFTESSQGNILFGIEYYAVNNMGFGEMIGFPLLNETLPGMSVFGYPTSELNSPISAKFKHHYPFQRHGKFSATKWALASDVASPEGKVSMPSAIPDNMVLLCYTPGPATHGNGGGPPFPDSDIAIMTGVEAPSVKDLIQLKNDPSYQEIQPIALVSWEAIYGKPPVAIEELPDSTHPLLPKGTPFGLVGTSSFYARETWAANGQNWTNQGSNATPGGVEFDSELIDRVRILGQMPSSNMSGSKNFYAQGGERLQVLGEVPLRKDGVVDKAGDPDTSFLARIPADVSFTFQLIAKDGTALTTAQTWHQVRPGEIRNDCRGCHAHHEPGLEFEGTAASLASYTVPDLTKNKPWAKEWRRDVWPTMKVKCISCHEVGGQAPHIHEDYPVMDGGRVRQDSTMFAYASRMSTMYTKMAAGHGEATPDEALTMAQFIDLGCQTNKRGGLVPPEDNNVFTDDQPPTLFVQSPRRKHAGPVTHLRVGAFDSSGLSYKSIKATFPVNGRAAGQELADLLTESDSVYSIVLTEPFVGEGAVTVSVVDAINPRTRRGNEKKLVRSFKTVAPPPAAAGQFVGMQDALGDLRSKTPDGRPDYHLHLTGLDATRPIKFIDVHGADPPGPANYTKNSNVAGEESPEFPHGKWWWIKTAPSIASETTQTESLDIHYSFPAGVASKPQHRVYVHYDWSGKSYDAIVVDIPPNPEL